MYMWQHSTFAATTPPPSVPKGKTSKASQSIASERKGHIVLGPPLCIASAQDDGRWARQDSGHAEVVPKLSSTRSSGGEHLPARSTFLTTRKSKAVGLTCGITPDRTSNARIAAPANPRALPIFLY